MLAAPLGSSAQRPLGYAVNARINVETGEVTGAWVAQVQVEQGQSSIRLWLYPDRLAVVPDAMTECPADGFSQKCRWVAGVQDVRVDGICSKPRRPRACRRSSRKDVAGADLVIPIANQGSRVVEVRLRFSLQLAQRFGRLSWVGRGYFSGSLVSARDRRAWRLAACS